MSVRKLKPTTPGQRFKVVSDFDMLTKGNAPEKALVKGKHRFPLGTIISGIEMRPGQGAVIARSAGTFAQLVARDGKYATVKMPSSEIRMILVDCMAAIGVVSNSDNQLLVSGKAGRTRWLGRRPRTRPVAMNPVDHPMGGGEGRASGGHPRSRNGILETVFQLKDLKLDLRRRLVISILLKEERNNRLWLVH